jgi:outer membrane immunogenic protein
MTAGRLVIAIVIAASSVARAAAETPIEKTTLVYWGGPYLGVGISHLGDSLKNVYRAPDGPSGFIQEDALAISAYGSHSFHGASFLLGLDTGYNLQLGNYVLGFEVDFSRLSQKQSAQNSYDTPFAGAGANLVSDRVPWLATLRPRLGYAFGRTLLYASGGVALAEARVNETTVSLTNAGADFYSFDRLATGWAVGAGVEYSIDSHWSVKAEYLNVELRALDGMSFTKSPLFMATTSVSYNHAFDLDNINIARIGANYRF